MDDIMLLVEVIKIVHEVRGFHRMTYDPLPDDCFIALALGHSTHIRIGSRHTVSGPIIHLLIEGKPPQRYSTAYDFKLALRGSSNGFFQPIAGPDLPFQILIDVLNETSHLVKVRDWGFDSGDAHYLTYELGARPFMSYHNVFGVRPNCVLVLNCMTRDKYGDERYDALCISFRYNTLTRGYKFFFLLNGRPETLETRVFSGTYTGIITSFSSRLRTYVETFIPTYRGGGK